MTDKKFYRFESTNFYLVLSPWLKKKQAVAINPPNIESKKIFNITS